VVKHEKETTDQEGSHPAEEVGELMEAVYESEYRGSREVGGRLAGAVSGIVTRILGCWHMDMSRPVTRKGETYRVCLDCGARRRFDVRAWRTLGGFYHVSPDKTADAAQADARGQSSSAGGPSLGPAHV